MAYQGKALSGPIQYAVINASSGDNTLVAADAYQHITVISYYFTMSTTDTVRFEGGAGGTALTGQMAQAAASVYQDSSDHGVFRTAKNTLLNLELGGGSAQGYIAYVLERQ